MRIHIFGDSHVRALYDGVGPLQEQLAQASIEVDFYSRINITWRSVEIGKDGKNLRFRAASEWEKPLNYAVTQLEDTYVFCSPLFSGILWREKAWKEFCPWRCAKNFPSLHPVSDALIENTVGEWMKTPLNLLKEMKQHEYIVLVAEPPKPLHRAPALKGVDPRIIVTLDNIFRSYMARRLTEIGVPIVPVPDFTHQDGFTPDRYSAPKDTDNDHGNAEFGTMMMKQILRFAAGKELN
jgi:hypothetical protein